MRTRICKYLNIKYNYAKKTFLFPSVFSLSFSIPLFPLCLALRHCHCKMKFILMRFRYCYYLSIYASDIPLKAMAAVARQIDRLPTTLNAQIECEFIVSLSASNTIYGLLTFASLTTIELLLISISLAIHQILAYNLCN